MKTNNTKMFKSIEFQDTATQNELIQKPSQFKRIKSIHVISIALGLNDWLLQIQVQIINNTGKVEFMESNYIL